MTIENRERYFKYIIAYVFAIYFSKYFRMPLGGSMWVIIAPLNCLILNSKKIIIILRKCIKNIFFILFIVLLSITLILGRHVQLNGSMYTGLANLNYISKYGINDIIAIPIVAIEMGIISAAIICFMQKISFRFYNEKKSGSSCWKKYSIGLFAVWFPYFLTHYPGYVVGDALNSIWQIKEIIPWSNHHPLVYTYLISICLKVGEAIKDITFGCAIYTVLQMIYLAVGLGYIIEWIRRKNVSEIYIYATFILFGFVPFFAELSIVMWKDPIFSVTIAIWTLMLADYVMLKGNISNIKKFLGIHLLLTLIICFFRNNGVYIILTVEAVMILIALFQKSRKEKIRGLHRLIISNLIVILVVEIITGPIYTSYNLQGEAVESFGIFLNQMARVVALNGEMSKSDREFMNELLPIEMYSENYHPCSIDLLKWNEKFDEEYLENHKGQFVKVWLSMFAKNPGCYFESWELMTIGYWGINRWELNEDASNITKGNLDILNEVENCGIKTSNLLENKYIDFEKIFKTEDASISLAVINWLALFITVLFCIRKKYYWIIITAPTLGNIATLLIASPYAYWQRYGLVQYYLIPIYIVLGMEAIKRKKKYKNNCSEFDKKMSI